MIELNYNVVVIELEPHSWYEILTKQFNAQTIREGLTFGPRDTLHKWIVK